MSVDCVSQGAGIDVLCDQKHSKFWLSLGKCAGISIDTGDIPTLEYFNQNFGRGVVQFEREDSTKTDQLWACFVRFVWSCVCEPSDGCAGFVREHFGLGPLRFLSTDCASEGFQRALSFLDESVVGLSQENAELYRRHSWKEALERWHKRLAPSRLFNICNGTYNLQIRILTPLSKLWPRGISDLGYHAPHLLYYIGSDECLQEGVQKISVVGARAITPYGEHVTADITAGLCSRNVCIVSGGAYGIDAIAHKTAIVSGKSTIAILAGGLDFLYPAGNVNLLRKVTHRGLIVSELPIGMRPHKWRFLQRNRVIAAISAATIIVEAGKRSGARNTANHALELGRLLCAVPGPVNSYRSVGCNLLLQDGFANLVTSSRDVFSLLGNLKLDTDYSTYKKAPLSSIATRILDALSKNLWRSVYDLSKLVGTSDRETCLGLVELEILGLVAERGNKWRLV